MGKKNASTIIGVTFCLFFMSIFSGRAKAQGEFHHFITVQGDQLMDGREPFRFISFNIPNLLLVEDNMAFGTQNPWRLPDAYEIEDALETVRQMGGRVARTYTISVRRRDDDPGTPKHVLGPGKFNEEAFRVMDQVLAIANRVGVRLIIPLVDNWKWMGGRPQYAAFRGKNPDDFWSDPQLREDFKKTIAFVLTRVNTITGVPYREDRAILAWELGNELRGCPPDWAEEMARTIKQLDPNHLLADGVQSSAIVSWALESRNIDLLSTHHYEGDPQKMVANILQAAAQARGKKPYYIGEFGFISTGGMEQVWDVVRSTPNIAGSLLWSLRFHNRDGGFYWHSEPMGAGLYKAYHWPGFTSGAAYDESGVLWRMRRAAYQIRQEPVPPLRIPQPPELHSVDDKGRISWQGSVGAEYYVVERARQLDGPWQIIGKALSDADQAYVPMFIDETVQPGLRHFYRVRAQNAAGLSEPSNVAGPMTVRWRTLVDECSHLQTVYKYGGKVHLESKKARAFKEDFHRFRLKRGAWIRYRVSGRIVGFRIYAFGQADSLRVRVALSADGSIFRSVAIRQDPFRMNTRDYPYRVPVLLQGEKLTGTNTFLEIRADEEFQVGRVEIFYR